MCQDFRSCDLRPVHTVAIDVQREVPLWLQIHHIVCELSLGSYQHSSF